MSRYVIRPPIDVELYPMNASYRQRHNFDKKKIAVRLAAFNISKTDNHTAKYLHESVISPNVETITKRFYAQLEKNPEFMQIINRGFDLEKLKRTQSDYLLSLGVNFDKPNYFEERLRIGATHSHVGVPLSLYLCAYRHLQTLLIQHIPAENLSGSSHYVECIDFILKITSLDMSLAVETYYLTKVNNLEQSLNTILQEDETLRHRVDTDALTELANHEHVVDVLNQSLMAFKKKGQPLCIIMADLDHFKNVNDTYGHLVGDKVLQDVAARMSAAVRDFDVVGRYGGEEFLIILTNTPIRRGQEIAERVRQHVGENNPIHANDVEISITISQGITEANREDNVMTLIERADKALYKAKEAGRNCVEIL